jgi:hypothetical protein
MTPHIVRFPDIHEEDLAPVWVGTESRISYFGSSSPRVHSGRAPTGPLDQPQRPGSNRPQRKPRETGGDKRDMPYGYRQRVDKPRGVSLVPGPDGKKDLDSVTLEPEGTDDRLEDKALRSQFTALDSALVVALEPSVVSLHPGQQTLLKLVAAGGSGPYRLSLGMSYDPARAAVGELEAPPWVELIPGEHDQSSGWLAFEVEAMGSEVPQVLVAFHVDAVRAGSVPLVMTAGGAIDADGVELPVAISDGALYVTGE